MQSDHDDPIKILDELLKTDIKIVQLREKNIPRDEKLILAKEFRKKTHKHCVLLIINDDIDIALEVKADGVHLGNGDTPLIEARKIAPAILIGKSTHSIKEAEQARDLGADYINVGPIFSTPTKTTYNPVGLDLYREISSKIDLPITVMGGINKNNIQEVIHSGAKRIAMVRAIISGNIVENIKILYNIYTEHLTA